MPPAPNCCRGSRCCCGCAAGAPLRSCCCLLPNARLVLGGEGTPDESETPSPVSVFEFVDRINDERDTGSCRGKEGVGLGLVNCFCLLPRMRMGCSELVIFKGGNLIELTVSLLSNFETREFVLTISHSFPPNGFTSFCKCSFSSNMPSFSSLCDFNLSFRVFTAFLERRSGLGLKSRMVLRTFFLNSVGLSCESPRLSSCSIMPSNFGMPFGEAATRAMGSWSSLEVRLPLLIIEIIIVVAKSKISEIEHRRESTATCLESGRGTERPGLLLELE